jgi:hypothetical protein
MRVIQMKLKRFEIGDKHEPSQVEIDKCWWSYKPNIIVNFYSWRSADQQ